MSDNQVSRDTPILNPDNDLLGMKTYARQLASFLNSLIPPFTVGIYGEWGEGKTTFVEFTRHYLINTQLPLDKVKFIKFSAWPHSSSDDLWRALILAIANELYADEIVEAERTAQSTNVSNELESSGLVDTLINFLRTDALVIYKPTSPPDPLAGYKKLLLKLDRTPANSISKDSQQHKQIDLEQALVATVKVLSASIASLSPLAASVQKLLGLSNDVDANALFQQERNEATRESIQSLHEFIAVIQETFAEKVQGKRVYIFIDDLDRCLPDVSLDVLEAIKVFLGEVNAIFLVAADETLIGKGLRLRYRDLPEESIEFSRKGNEYFEKIIQFSIRVPARTREQTHNFIAAQFPQWMPVTDIIEAAIGSNPRRLKQSGNQLAFEYKVFMSEKNRM